MREDGLIAQLDNLVREHPDFESLHEPTLDGYYFRCVPNRLVERQDEPEVEALLDVLNNEIVQAVRRMGFNAVVTNNVHGRAAIRVSFDSDRASAEDVDTTFESIARWGRLLTTKLSDHSEPEMETKLCSSGSHSSPTEVSAI